MAQRKKPLWQLCYDMDWAAVQQRIRDKDVEDINEKGGAYVSFHAILTTFIQARNIENVNDPRDMKQMFQIICNTEEVKQRLGSWFL